MQILKGRLIAVGAFVIFTLCINFLPIVGFILAIALMIAIPYFTNQSLAFSRRMSAYKNIQFRFKATYGEAFMVLFVWPMVGMISFGILYPLAILKMHQYIVRNSAYGTTKFDYSATFEDYGKIFLVMIGVGLVFAAAIGILAYLMPALAGLYMVLVPLLYLALILFFTTKMTNLFCSSLSLAEHKFKAEVTMGGFALVILINAFLTAITLGLYLPAAKVRMVKYISSCIVMDAQDSLDNFAAAEKENVSALGEELGQVFDFA